MNNNLISQIYKKVPRILLFLIWFVGLVLASCAMDMWGFKRGAVKYQNFWFIISRGYYMSIYIFYAMWVTMIPALWVIPFFRKTKTRTIWFFFVTMLLLKGFWGESDHYVSKLEISGLIIGVTIVIITSYILAYMMKDILYKRIDQDKDYTTIIEK